MVLREPGDLFCRGQRMVCRIQEMTLRESGDGPVRKMEVDDEEKAMCRYGGDAALFRGQPEYLLC